MLDASMKILFAISGYKPAYRMGGPVLSVSALAEHLVQKGHEVTVVTTNANLDEDLDVPLGIETMIEGVRVIYFKRTEFFSRLLPFIPYLAKGHGFAYAPDMKTYLKENIDKYDLVHTHLPFNYPTYIAGRLARKFDKPFFYHQRGVLDPVRLRFRSLKKRLYISLFEISLLKSATMLFALTLAEAENYRKIGVTTPVRVIPNGIEVKDYLVKPEGNELNIPPDAQLILFLGRLHPIKGADKMIDAFISVHDKIPAAMLVMAGPDEWGLEKRYVKKIYKLNLDNRVIFPGMVSGKMKKNLLARADLFYLPSEAEGFSMAILEALVSLTPVVISPGCNFPQVEAADAGRVVNNDVSSLGNSLVELLGNPELLGLMASNARRLIVQNYTWGKIADDMLNAYSECMSKAI